MKFGEFTKIFVIFNIDNFVELYKLKHYFLCQKKNNKFMN